jgi:hypothetical protein
MTPARAHRPAVSVGTSLKEIAREMAGCVGLLAALTLPQPFALDIQQ